MIVKVMERYQSILYICLYSVLQGVVIEVELLVTGSITDNKSLVQDLVAT